MCPQTALHWRIQANVVVSVHGAQMKNKFASIKLKISAEECAECVCVCVSYNLCDGGGRRRD